MYNHNTILHTPSVPLLRGCQKITIQICRCLIPNVFQCVSFIKKTINDSHLSNNPFWSRYIQTNLELMNPIVKDMQVLLGYEQYIVIGLLPPTFLSVN